MSYLSKRGFLTPKLALPKRLTVPGRASIASGVPTSSVAVLPQESFITHRYLMTDISQLWQGADGTSQVTAGGQDVQSITNSGTSGGIAATDGATDRPQWNATEGAVQFLEPSCLTQALGVSDMGAAWTVCVLGYKAEGLNADTDIYFEIDNIGECSFRCAYTLSPDVYTVTQMDISEVMATTVHPTYGDYASVVGASTATGPAQLGRFSTETVLDSASGTHNTPTGGTNIRLGANTDIGGNGFEGFLKEAIVWDGVALDAAEMQLVADYDAATYGLTWTAIA